MYTDKPNRSPWIEQMAEDGPPRPLPGPTTTDVVVVGAGIAGVATAFFILRATTKRVLLIERDRVARGATGRNAGQLTTYFERPLSDIADQYGTARAVDAQRGFDDAHELLDLMVAEAGSAVRLERFTGHLGMFNLHQLEVHLASKVIRDSGGLRAQTCVVSEQAEFLTKIPAEFDGHYSVVPQSEIRSLLEVDDDRYGAVLSARAGCANSGALAQQVLAYLLERHPDRFEYADCTNVARVDIGDGGAVVHAGDHRVAADQVVLCTNGFVDHAVRDSAGAPILLSPDQQIVGRVAYMAAFVEDEPRPPAAMSYIRNPTIGGPVAYVYVTRRTYDRADDTVTLACMGGPEYPFHEPVYDRDGQFPGELLTVMDAEVRPYAQPARLPGQRYDYHWHGLMGYNDGGTRVVGGHPLHPRLLYNLGCNGVGFLPSICGADRLARLFAGERLEPSIFDPRPST